MDEGIFCQSLMILEEEFECLSSRQRINHLASSEIGASILKLNENKAQVSQN